MALSDSIHLAFLMAYHAVGKIKWGNLFGGGLMILSLPLGYIALKFGAPPYSVFIIILIMNFISHMICWYLLHQEVNFSYTKLFRTVYLPCISVTLLSMITPTAIILTMTDGLARLLILTFLSEIAFISFIYTIGFNNDEKKELINPLLSKILARFKST